MPGKLRAFASEYALTPMGSMNSVLRISPGWTANTFLDLAMAAPLLSVFQNAVGFDQSPHMPLFCDVALAVPLDLVFTYAIPPGMEPVVGGRVLVPFRQQRLSGIVVELHDRPPQVKTQQIKKVIEALDLSPVLDEQLLKLGKWIADYYLAPIGEVFRTMLPLSAEFKRSVEYRITDEGRMALHLAGMSGSPARLVKVAVLLAAEERAEAAPPLDGRGARPHTNPATPTAKKLNENQQALIEALAASGGRAPVEALRGLDVPRTTLGTLVRRGLIELVDEPQAGINPPTLKPRQSPFEFEFSAAQNEALGKIGEAVASRKFSGLLLHGITGSGKTAVYLACMRQVLDQGRSSILLVPEIGLTPAVAADLHQVFGDEVAILHSGLSNAERAEQWHRIRRGEARVVAGTRSAVFAPVNDLALIIVDEEQDSSYKQEETPRYHARDVAVMRAKMAGAVVALGSATPSLESYYNAKKNKYALVELPDRVERRPLPEVEIVDMRQEFQETGQEQVISRKLADEIRERLDKKEQVMVLLNRRGYSPVVLCRACGKTLQCQNCAVSMTHHKRERKMECHYCGYVAHIPDKCAHCGSEYVYFVGTGSEKLEELLHGMFPQARIGRLDRDTVRGREDFERALNALNEGELDMLVGTQMIAKGHDIHGVTLVGVVGADMALS